MCEDDVHADCERRASRGCCHGACGDGDPYLEARRTLSECRASCREYYRGWHPGDLPEMIKLYGGLEDYVMDGFGFRYELCDPSMGFTSSGRMDVLYHSASYAMTNDWVPQFTRVGFEKSRIPDHLYEMILTEYEEMKKRPTTPEACEPSVINCQKIYESDEKCFTTENSKIYMMWLSEGVQQRLREDIQPLAEAWAGVSLEHTSTYGIRRYTNGSWLIAHIDRFTTHVISAILNIGQSVTKEWELHILDNSGEAHAVTLLPGEMIWYESARLLHGRPDALLGDYFDNLFIHYKPTHLWYAQQAEFGRKPRNNPITLAEIKRAQERKL